MAKDSKSKKALKTAGFIAMHPMPFLIILLIILAIILYVAQSVNSEATQILKLYDSVTSKVEDSKVGFNKKLFYIKVDENGNKTITIGFTDEVAQEEAEQAAEESGTTDPGSDVKLSQDAEAIRHKLANSQFAAKADVMALAYQMLHEAGYPDNACIGMMANINAEGNYGTVEYKFVKNGGGELKQAYNKDGNPTVPTQYVGKYITNPVTKYNDIVTLRDIGGGPSLGFGPIQWSYGRRVGYANKCLEYMKSDADVTQENFAKAVAAFISEECNPSGSYYTAMIGGLGKINKTADTATCEEWAEAFCDYYEKPGGWCGVEKSNGKIVADHRMTTKGTACVTRRGFATAIAKVLSE